MKDTIYFVTSSTYKQEENAALQRVCQLADGSSVSDRFEFHIVPNRIRERLETRIVDIVEAEVREAYAALRKPCVVEHAGLIFDEYCDQDYPGGLTKPLWNTLGDRFLSETHSSGRMATALAVVAYCDGMRVWSFQGETAGMLSDAPRGDRKFYWDTVFIPRDNNPAQLTYAEIVAQEGLERKMRDLSQSSKAMLAFLNWRMSNPPRLWEVSY
jgi:inosine/xanthosine triphosphate pyrophosphatase family protein